MDNVKIKRHYKQRAGTLIRSKEHLLGLLRVYKNDNRLAKFLGCSRQNVEQLRKKWGIARSELLPTKTDKIVDILRVSEDKTSFEVARQVNCTVAYVRFIARGFNLRFRKVKPVSKLSIDYDELKKLQKKYGIDRNIACVLGVTTAYVCMLRKKYNVPKIQ